MGKALRKILLVILFIAFLQSGSAGADDAFNYGPACQWIRLRGTISEQTPSDGKSIFLTVFYQIDGMKRPANLLVKHPLSGQTFNFVLAGFGEEIPGAIFVPPFFFFAKEIEFTYQAATSDKSWASGWHSAKFSPERIKRGREVLCQTEIELKL